MCITFLDSNLKFMVEIRIRTDQLSSNSEVNFISSHSTFVKNFFGSKEHDSNKVVEFLN